MTVEEFTSKYGLKKSLIDKYGIVYFIVQDIIHINKIEKLLEESGFTVKRQTENYVKTNVLFSDIYFENKHIGFIDLQGFPSIEFFKRCRKYVKNIKENEIVINPIPGVHRILDWHTVKDKMHCLAGGETVLHCIPTEMTEDLIEEWVKELKLEPLLKK